MKKYKSLRTLASFSFLTAFAIWPALSRAHSNHQELERLLQIKDAKGNSILPEAEEFNSIPEPWSQLDSKADHIEGTSTAQMYANPKFPAAKKEIVVAVIDEGVDIHHEDLKGHIWVNLLEFGGKPGVDDDNNGYVDDIYGWNFLGNNTGENVNGSTLELTREYAFYKKKNTLHPLQGKEAAYFSKIKADFEDGLDAAKNEVTRFQTILKEIALLKTNGLTEETPRGISAIQSKDLKVNDAKDDIGEVYQKGYSSSSIEELLKASQIKVQFNYNLNFDSSSIVHDDPKKGDDLGYGNNDVVGPRPKHGTHVAGIIAADRNNHIDIQGQSDSVKIMSIRATPNGDERDKDVANAIDYAVKNGASVINMSFGKKYSRNKSWVDQAVARAEAKGVILVHAAGNDSKNTESFESHFPNKKLLAASNLNAHDARTWVEVGASGPILGPDLAYSETNWGKTSVDLFAPGVKILSTVANNQTDTLSGTSMAAPQVAGIIATLMSRFPEKTPQEIIDAVMSTTTNSPYANLKLDKHSQGLTLSFPDLSKTGGIINAERAMLKLLDSSNQK